jgi:hypothetical protein
LESETHENEKVRAGEEVERERRRREAEAREAAGGRVRGKERVSTAEYGIAAGQSGGGEGGGGENKLRLRLAEVLSSAGVDEGRVALEVLYLLPQEFVRGYTDLFHRALRAGDEGMGGRNDAKAELGRSLGREKAGGKTPKKAGGRGPFAVRDEKALGEKQRIDRQLRKLARSMRDGGAAGTGKEQVSRCGEDSDKEGCGKWVESGWNWCPYCGTFRSLKGDGRKAGKSQTG